MTVEKFVLKNDRFNKMTVDKYDRLCFRVVKDHLSSR